LLGPDSPGHEFLAYQRQDAAETQATERDQPEKRFFERDTGDVTDQHGSRLNLRLDQAGVIR
jgi:hypothetical protein